MLAQNQTCDRRSLRTIERPMLYVPNCGEIDYLQSIPDWENLRTYIPSEDSQAALDATVRKAVETKRRICDDEHSH